MRQRIVLLFIIVVAVGLIVTFALRRSLTNGQVQKVPQVEKNKQDTQHSGRSTSPLIPLAGRFDYPIGDIKQKKKLSQSNDGDGWYNAQDFGVNNHLGEDWNSEAGGRTDCGLPVYAASNGTIVFAADAGIGWGKVLIVRHRLPDDTLVETLYGHLRSFAKMTGDLKHREQIGSVGDANGAYPCHLHFELRLADCPAWGAVGPGYSENRGGWTDPSDFIDAHRDLPSKLNHR